MAARHALPTALLILIAVVLMRAPLPSRHPGAGAYRIRPSYTPSHALDPIANLPLHFEVNAGQTDPQVRFLSRGRGYTLFVTPGEVVLSLKKTVASGHSSVVSGQQSAISGRNHESQVTNHDSLVVRIDRKSTRLNSSHIQKSRMPSSA